MFYTLRGSHLHWVPTMWVAFHFTHEQSLGFFFFQLLLRFLTGSKLTSSPLKMLLATWLTTYIVDRFPNGDIIATPLSQRRKEIFWMGTQKPAVGIHGPVLYLNKKSKTVQCFPTQHDSCVFLSPDFVHLWVSGKDLFKVGTFKLKEVMSYLNNDN